LAVKSGGTICIKGLLMTRFLGLTTNTLSSKHDEQGKWFIPEFTSSSLGEEESNLNWYYILPSKKKMLYICFASLQLNTFSYSSDVKIIDHCVDDVNVTLDI
jgi:hypothetical protein